MHDTSLLSEMVQMHKEQDESPFKDLDGFKGIKHRGDLTIISIDMPEHRNFYDGFPFTASNLATMAFDKQAVYLATGKKGPARLKQLLNDSKSSSTEPVCESGFGFNVSPFLRIFLPQLISTGPTKDLQQGDEVAIQINPIENGYKSTLAVDLGVLTTCIKHIGNSQQSSFQANHQSTAMPVVRSTSPRSRTQRSSKLTEKQQREFEKGFREGLKKGISN